MSETQRIIKYIATAFAIFLAFSIIMSIVSGIGFLGNIFGNDNTNSASKELASLSIENKDFSYLDINVKSVNLIIQRGDYLKADTNNKYINVRQDNNRINITERNHTWFSNNLGDLIVYIPDSLLLDEVVINSGAGSLKIESLNAKKLQLELGAGRVNIDNLNVMERTTIDGGAGAIDITNSNLSNTDFDMGVGKLSISAILNGNTEIDSGVGEVNLNVIGLVDDYKVHVDKGLGSVIVNNTSLGDDATYGNGTKLIDIDGGIGSINVKFNND